MTTAMIASSSSPSPAVGCAEPSWPTVITAASADHQAHQQEDQDRVERVLMPARRAAIGSPPIA